MTVIKSHLSHEKNHLEHHKIRRIDLDCADLCCGDLLKNLQLPLILILANLDLVFLPNSSF